LRKRADDLLKYEDEIIERATREGVEDVDGLVDELYELSEFRRIVDSGGLRGSLALTLKQKEEIFDYTKKYFNNEEILKDKVQFTDDISTQPTAYGTLTDMLVINSDIMPGSLKSANSRLSWRAAIAHELVGHRSAALNGKTFNNNTLSFEANWHLEEIQASIRANKRGIDLTKIEREDLYLDALERFEKYSHLFKGTEFEGLTFEKIIEKLWI
tara:strand:- start:1901 stop:2542 length:642 start_codon:yes stop_codon:yes gene_type:complete